jgi:hypothetical protein
MHQQVAQQHSKKTCYWNSRDRLAQGRDRQEIYQRTKNSEPGSPPQNNEPPAARAALRNSAPYSAAEVIP